MVQLDSLERLFQVLWGRTESEVVNINIQPLQLSFQEPDVFGQQREM